MTALKLVKAAITAAFLDFLRPHELEPDLGNGKSLLIVASNVCLSWGRQTWSNLSLTYHPIF